MGYIYILALIVVAPFKNHKNKPLAKPATVFLFFVIFRCVWLFRFSVSPLLYLPSFSRFLVLFWFWFSLVSSF
jgi:hypothetical protein